VCAKLLQNLNVDGKVEAAIQLEIDRLAAENLVRCGCFGHLLVDYYVLFFYFYNLPCFCIVDWRQGVQPVRNPAMTIPNGSLLGHLTKCPEKWKM